MGDVRDQETWYVMHITMCNVHHTFHVHVSFRIMAAKCNIDVAVHATCRLLSVEVSGVIDDMQLYEVMLVLPSFFTVQFMHA